jgi:ribosome maturation factor RimP
LIAKSDIRKFIEEGIEGTDVFIVELTVSEQNHIHVVADADSGLSIDKCVAVSRSIEGRLDREVEDFELQVTSPGLSNPLKVIRQYKKNVGRGLKVRTVEEESLEGTLVEATDEGIVLEHSFKQRIEGRKKKEIITERIPLAYDRIKEAKVMISFK